MSSSIQSRSFCVTINGDPEWFAGPTEADALAEFLRSEPNVRYAKFQFETFPTPM